MIEIKINIEEKSKDNLNELKFGYCEVDIKEIVRQATESEIKTSEILKERLKVNQKIQLENLSKKKSDDEVLKELLKLLIK